MSLARRRRLLPLLLLLAAAGLYALYRAPNLLSLRSAVAQNLGIEREDYKLYPTASAPQDFYGRVYSRARLSPVKLANAASPVDARAKVGFSVAVPSNTGLKPVDSFIINGEHAYQVEIDLDEARRILLASGLPTQTLSASSQGLQIKFNIPASVVQHQSQGDRWYTLIEASPGMKPEVDESNSALLTALLELNLRHLGLTAQDARRFSREFGWEDFFVVPPTDLAHAELISVSGSPALLLSQHRVDAALHAIIWQSGEILYGLYGNLPPDELLRMAEALRTP